MSAEENAGEVICTVTFAKRPDGGMRVFSQDLPGLILSHSDPDKVAADVWPAVKVLIERGATRRTPQPDALPGDLRKRVADWAERIDAITWHVNTSALDEIISEMRLAAAPEGK
jgi:hypothetical protein